MNRNCCGAMKKFCSKKSGRSLLSLEYWLREKRPENKNSVEKESERVLEAAGKIPRRSYESIMKEYERKRNQILICRVAEPR